MGAKDAVSERLREFVHMKIQPHPRTATFACWLAEAVGQAPSPKLLLHMKRDKLVEAYNLHQIPQWVNDGTVIQGFTLTIAFSREAQCHLIVKTIFCCES